MVGAMQTLKARVDTATALSPTVVGLTLRPLAPFQHVAGQYVCVLIEVDGEAKQLYLSIASAPRSDTTFDLCVGSAGAGAAALQRIMVGQEVELRGPGGTFTLAEPPTRPILMVAAGTGIAPIRAQLQRFRELGAAPPVNLLQGARQSSDLLYRQEFEAAAADNPNVRYLPCLTQPEASWVGRRGRVVHHLAEVMDDIGTAEVDVYICGQKALIDSTTEAARQRGVPDACLHFERY